MNIAYSIALGVAIIIFAQLIIDWFRARANSVNKEEFEALERKFNKLVVKLERQGIETNGD
jgi:hypothetical protein